MPDVYVCIYNSTYYLTPFNCILGKAIVKDAAYLNHINKKCIYNHSVHILFFYDCNGKIYYWCIQIQITALWVYVIFDCF